ncbi:hypothetical protein CEXT_783661 [Caerostris extrusa]|uniref:Uncharacterized protein n=1 Tax=Caerostris extrusa TaxID=172846 RepID=A0AAV4NVM2_CAEEX|nr:hypothetical protein CEXT_783661 [Caerostris extrusa]
MFDEFLNFVKLAAVFCFNIREAQEFVDVVNVKSLNFPPQPHKGSWSISYSTARRFVGNRLKGLVNGRRAINLHGNTAAGMAERLREDGRLVHPASPAKAISACYCSSRHTLIHCNPQTRFPLILTLMELSCCDWTLYGNSI